MTDSLSNKINVTNKLLCILQRTIEPHKRSYKHYWSPAMFGRINYLPTIMLNREMMENTMGICDSIEEVFAYKIDVDDMLTNADQVLKFEKRKVDLQSHIRRMRDVILEKMRIFRNYQRIIRWTELVVKKCDQILSNSNVT